MERLNGKVLMEIFNKAFENYTTFKCLDSELSNPAHILFNGEEYYVYIKNLSSAYFDNPDVWRAQLTGIDALKLIKDSDAIFVLLGFDSNNNVYATWNPNQVKQRIGTASSPSLYSRLSLQEEVSKTGEIKSMTLNNDLMVLVFPLKRLVEVFSKLNTFFPDTSNYVALGSKRRADANMAYKKFSNTQQIREFANYLQLNGFSPSEIVQKCSEVKSILTSGLISSHRKIFLAHDSISEYKEAAEELFSLQEVKDLGWDTRYISLISYIDFLQGNSISSLPENETDIVIDDKSEESEIEEEPNVVRDWETDYEDESGNLIKLMNPVLLKQLRPYLDREYQSFPPAFNIIHNFYGERYPKMEFKDWGRLLKEIDWSKCNDDGIIQDDVKVGKKKTHIIRVEFPDGRIVENKNVSTTYCEFIKEVGAEKISLLGILHAGVNIVSKELDSKYAKCQKDIGNGWYVMTNTSTRVKYLDMQKIIEEYRLKIRVSLVSKNTLEVTSNPIPYINTNKRDKIYVQFPDGRIIQHNKVLDTLIDVVKFAGASRVHSLNIICCGDNLVLRNPSSRYIKPSKDVGNGWFCNTCSDTLTKYEQIKTISERLNLGLIIKLIHSGYENDFTTEPLMVAEQPLGYGHDDSFDLYIKKINNIRQAVINGEAILAKPALLLAIIDGINEGFFAENKFILSEWLERHYSKLMKKYTVNSQFTVVTGIEKPFWHLATDGFWHLKLKGEAKEGITPSMKWLKENVIYASLDDDLWTLLQNKEWREKLREFIVEKKLQG